MWPHPTRPADLGTEEKGEGVVPERMVGESAVRMGLGYADAATGTGWCGSTEDEAP